MKDNSTEVEFVRKEKFPKRPSVNEREESILRKTITIPKGAKMHTIGFGHSVQYGMKHYQILIGIGKDYTAVLTIDEDAYEALMNGGKINVS